MDKHGTHSEAPRSPPDAMASKARDVLIIHNPTAGRRRGGLLARVVEALKELGFRVETAATTGRGDAMRLAREAQEAGIIAVAGGDGTVNEAINGLGGGKRLAIIPLGTANVLAAELGLPNDPQALAEIAAAGAVREISVGEAALAGGTRRFTMMAGVGFDAHVVARVPSRLKRAVGKWAYGWQMLVEWLRSKPVRYRITADGESFDCASAIIANGRFYAGRYVAAPNASLDNTSFELVLFERGGRFAILRYALSLGLGRLHKSRGVRIVRAREISIEGPPDEPVHADGDVIGTLPARFAIAGERLPVLVPRRS